MGNKSSRRGRAGGLVALSVGAGAMGLAMWEPSAPAFPQYFTAWVDRYPMSTLPQRMATLTGTSCNVCHRPPGTFADGTCYREAIRSQLRQGKSIEEALEIVEPMDSDEDGYTNLEEILAVRIDEPSQIGYHPGLVGPLGDELCGFPPEPITMVPETPCAADFNLDGRRDIRDFSAFQNAFALGLRRADVNRDGVLDVRDFTEFQNQFALGCR